MAQSSAAMRLAGVRRRRELAHSSLVEQLAVLAEFDAARVDHPDAPDVIRHLCSNVPRSPDRPLFVLSARARIDALTAVLRRDGATGLAAVRAAAPAQVDTPLQRMLDVFTRQQPITEDHLDEDELLAALEVWRWATEAVARARASDAVRVPFDRDLVEGLLARLQVTRAVRKLAAQGCVGRDGELQRLRGYVDAPTDDAGFVSDPAMVVYGIGGVGKSTLMARFVMDLVVGRRNGLSPAWAYLDMDRPTLRSYETEAILDEIVRQVAAQFPQGRRRLEGVRREVRRMSKGAGLESFDRAVPYDAADRLAADIAELGDGRLVVILDTFEEVAQAEPSRPEEIFDLFAALSGVLDTLKLIVVGRVPAGQFVARGDRILHVRDFTGDAAVRLLRHFLHATPGGGDVVDDDILTREVVATVGGNPLTLRLAARVLAAEGRRGFDDAKRRATVERVRHEFIQGFLYRRILEHIEASDAAVTDALRAVAKATLVLRKVTPELLDRVVLPAMARHVDRDGAWLYAELASEVAFVEQYPDHLRLREELRRPALLAVGYEDRGLVDRIHRAAADYYGSRTAGDPDAEEELAYHLLALGTPPADLQLDYATIRRAASSLVGAPPGVDDDLRALHEASDAELAGEREQLAWERRVWSETDAALRSGHLDSARALLAERTVRRPTTELHRLDSRLLEAEGDLSAALDLNRHDLGAAHLAGDRIRFAATAVRTAELEERLGQVAAADTLRGAADDVLLAGDHALRLELHLNRLATLERMERLDDDERWFLELDARALLARLPPGDVESSTPLIKLLAATLGRDQPGLLRLALGRVGLGPDEDAARLQRLAVAIDDWDRAQDEPGRLARILRPGTTGPVGATTWISELAGLGTEAQLRLERLWAAQEPPEAVREALRAFYLWWGRTPAAMSGEAGGQGHFLDQPLDFSRAETQQLHRIVVDGYGDPDSLLRLADRAGVNPNSVDLTGSPDAMIRKFLLQASNEEALGHVVEKILDDPSAGTLATTLRDLVRAPEEYR